MITYTPVTPDGALEVGILEKAYEHQQYLKTLLLQHTGRNVFLLEPDLSAEIRAIPFPSLINKIEQNLDMLFGSWRPSGRRASVEWLGEILDQRFLDYTDVNRWFEMMQFLEALIPMVSKRVPISGTFRAGNNRTRQIIKRKAFAPDIKGRVPISGTFRVGSERTRQIVRRKYTWHYVLDGSWRLGEKPFAYYT